MNSFVKEMDEIQKFQSRGTIFYGAEMLSTVWETKPEIIEKLLPAPLKPVANKPYVTTFVANYPKNSFAPPYKEAAIYIHAECDGVEGRYCLSMPITDDMAMAAGREVYGLPKKMADIEFEVKDGKVRGKLSRHGIDFFTVTADLDGKLNQPDEEEGFTSALSVPMYNISYAKSADGKGFLLNPTLIRAGLKAEDVKEFKLGSSQVTMVDSPHDPWAELEVVRMIGSRYVVSTNSLLPGEVLHDQKINPMEFVPYSFIRWDWLY